MKTDKYIEMTGVTDHKEDGYEIVAERTENDFNLGFLVSMLRVTIKMSTQLDQMKKILIYGKNNGNVDGMVFHNESYTKVLEARAKELPKYQPLDTEKAKMMHYLLGIITEAGELAEVLEDLIEGREVDSVNLKEELGDLQWYTARALNNLGSSYEEIFETNINKLKTRFGDKFDAHAALNRDLDKERKVLEDGEKE